ncbi:MAG: response regulator transcription factor [Acidimicrobiia bacterium]
MWAYADRRPGSDSRKVWGVTLNFGELTLGGLLPTFNSVQSPTQLLGGIGDDQTELQPERLRLPSYLAPTVAGSRGVDVVICDDHGLFAEALATFLTHRGHHVVAVSANPSAAVEAVGQVGVDLCIMDLLFPDESGIDGTRRVREASPTTRVIVLTGAGDDARAAAVEAGADAVVAKESEVSVFLDAIDRAAHGKSVRPVNGVDPRVPEPSLARDPVAVQASFLSPRERDVLELLVDGCNTRGVGGRLGIAHSTARTHIQNVLMKLGCHSRLEVAALAVEHGLTRRASPAAAGHACSAS